MTDWRGQNLRGLYDAARHVVDEGLRKDGSVFTPGRTVWSAHVAADLHRRFVQQPDASSDTFEVKFQRQLAGAPPDTIQLAAELLFVHFFPRSTK